MNLLIFFIVAFTVLHADALRQEINACPIEDNIKPCTCEKICPSCLPTIICPDIRNQAELLDLYERSGDFPFMDAIIANSSILYIPAESMERKQFTLLAIVNTTLASLFDGPPPEGSRLQQLTLHTVTLQRGIDWRLFSTLNDLSSVTFINTSIRKVTNTFGSNLPKGIRQVMFLRTSTSNIGDKVFEPLKNLEVITVSQCEVRKIGRSMFPTPYNGVLLNFEGNKIEALPDDLFTEMPRLSTIILKENQIVTFSESVFGTLAVNVRSIFLEGNPIICDCKVRWLPEKENMPYIGGNCTGTNENAGKIMRNLIRRDFTYCIG